MYLYTVQNYLFTYLFMHLHCTILFTCVLLITNINRVFKRVKQKHVLVCSRYPNTGNRVKIISAYN